MQKKVKLTSLAGIMAVTLTAVFLSVNIGHAENADYSKPLLTIACLSDLHNQGPIITGDNAVMRGTIGETIDQMIYDEENVDAVIVGGDVSSDNQTTEEKLYRILDMVQDKVSELTPNTMWITGNHDYNAGESEYNSADYYNRYTGPAMGMLTDNNIYIENYKGIDYVCGYHYVINGFDLICLCDSYETLEGGKQHYNYAYSDGTFEWLSDTLDDIEYYREKDEEGKPIFIIAHFPFRDSNSLSDVSKGMIEDSNKKMKDILRQHSNIFYLYGHDHAKDTAYIRTDTAQRVTEYDEYGNVMNPPEIEDEGDNENTELGKKSFTSVFMGSMRYYNNSIDGWVNENNSKVVQALMVYVYYDRIEFAMKNYGTQDAGSWEIKPYVVNGQVMPFPTPVPTKAPESGADITAPPQVTNKPEDNTLANPQAGISDNAGEDKILVPKAVIKSCKKVKSSKAAVIIKKLSGIKKYQIKASESKKFKKKDTVAKSFSGTKCTLKKLKKRKTYYIKVRAYKMINGKKVYGDWSSIKRIKM